MTNPTEPTLTCSEVVERLRAECYFPDEERFDDAKAEAILHSWREHIEQELQVDYEEPEACGEDAGLYGSKD